MKQFDHYTVEADAQLLDWLLTHLDGSHSKIKATLQGRGIQVNGKTITRYDYPLKAGMKIAVSKTKRNLTLKNHYVKIVYEDPYLVVVEKNVGILSMAAGHSTLNVKSVLDEYFEQTRQHCTAHVVHRLDRDTTGCLMFAKNHAALEAAIEEFKTHAVSKVYHAIVVGEFKFAHRLIDTPLDGQNAVSRVTREAKSADASFLRVRIDTGRTNQIRRHLASLRFPIVGDRVFGLKNARDPRLMRVPRQMLHASTLALPHPLSRGGEISVHSPLPADFRAALKLFGMGK